VFSTPASLASQELSQGEHTSNNTQLNTSTNTSTNTSNMSASTAASEHDPFCEDFDPNVLLEAEQHCYSMPAPLLEPQFNEESYLNQPAIPATDTQRISDFYHNLSLLQLEYCATCHRKWFDLQVIQAECKNCRQDRLLHRGQQPYIPLFSAANNLDPGEVPPELPTLTYIEEMLIARVHIFMEVRQHRGVQYKYKGHICHFVSNVGKVYSRLPLLPQDLDILILKPPSSEADNQESVQRQFQKDYKVRRSVVYTWLQYLTAHHPGYRDIEVCNDTLAALPINGSVEHQLAVVNNVEPLSSAPQRSGYNNPSHMGSSETNTSTNTTTPATTNPQPNIDIIGEGYSDAPNSEYGSSISDYPEDDCNDSPDSAAVPDLAPDTTEFEILRQQIQQSNRQALFSVGSIRQTPIAEFNNSERLLSVAFPSLFPQGKADFATPRMRDVSFSSYIKLMVCYKDGRFARHPRFRYAVFNTLLRKQSIERAGFLVRSMSTAQTMSAADIQAAFTSEDRGDSLMHSLVRFSSAIRGTRPYWMAEGKKLESMVCLSVLVLILYQYCTNTIPGPAAQMSNPIYYFFSSRLSLE
jgi:hypothetical protein